MVLLTKAQPRARRRKELRYPELVGPGSRARLVVLALEVGGKWSPERRTFVAQLAKAKKLDVNPTSCRRGPNRLGGCGAEQSSRAQQRRPSRHVSWASGAHIWLTGTPLSVGRWRRTTATLGWLPERLEAATCARF